LGQNRERESLPAGTSHDERQTTNSIKTIDETHILKNEKNNFEKNNFEKNNFEKKMKNISKNIFKKKIKKK
jgi:hypothetical protein